MEMMVQLATDPIITYADNLSQLMKLPSGLKSETLVGGNYSSIIFLLPYIPRQKIAVSITNTAIRAFVNNGFKINSAKAVRFFFGEVCGVLMTDQIDGNLYCSLRSEWDTTDVDPFEWEDISDQQTQIAKLIKIIRPAEESQMAMFELLLNAKAYIEQGGDVRQRFTIAPLVFSMLQAADAKAVEESGGKKLDLSVLYRNVNETIGQLNNLKEDYYEDEDAVTPREGKRSLRYDKKLRGLKASGEMALRLFLLAADSADMHQQEEMCYEFFVQAFIAYEESISDSKAQFAAINLIIYHLGLTSVFEQENYITLVTKAVIHCARLLKRSDQCRGILLASHLFWQDDSLKRIEGKSALRDGKKALECLQKSLKLADSVIDRNVGISLFVDILEKYLWFFENKNDSVRNFDVDNRKIYNVTFGVDSK